MRMDVAALVSTQAALDAPKIIQLSHKQLNVNTNFSFFKLRQFQKIERSCS